MSNPLAILLASNSPRRQELLNQVDISHGRLVVDIDETQRPNETPTAYIERMVEQKAQTALQVISDISDDVLVITADTIGVLPSGAVLQKPENMDSAINMWRQMSGTTHEVWTAVQVSRISRDNDSYQLLIANAQRTIVKTEVEFIHLTEEMMTHYWATGEPQDKAGGYAIQGRAGAWVKAIHGSYSNVVGLPLAETLELLQRVNQH